LGGGVVGHLDGLGVGLEAIERGHRTKGLLLGDDHVGQRGRLEEAAALRSRLPPMTTLALS
jgi:hypothetical protein